MNEYEKKQLRRAFDLMTEVMAIVEELAGEVQTVERTIYEIEKYVSGSGNTTWRAQCEDGTRLYFRQAGRELYERDGIWDKMNDLAMDSVYGCYIDVETLPDGDFHKIVKVNKWEIVENEPPPF
jgi:hypothetical protein